MGWLEGAVVTYDEGQWLMNGVLGTMMGDNSSKKVDETAKLYLELIKKCLTDSLDFERSLMAQMRVEANPKHSLRVAAKNKMIQDMKRRGISLYRPPWGTVKEHKQLREEGRDWPE